MYKECIRKELGEVEEMNGIHCKCYANISRVLYRKWIFTFKEDLYLLIHDDGNGCHIVCSVIDKVLADMLKNQHEHLDNLEEEQVREKNSSKELGLELLRLLSISRKIINRLDEYDEEVIWYMYNTEFVDDVVYTNKGSELGLEDIKEGLTKAGFYAK